MLISKRIIDNEPDSLFVPRAIKFRNIQQAIDEFYARAFAPEIIYAMNFVEDTRVSAELISKYAKLSGADSANISFQEQKFQTNLLYIQQRFEEALSSLKLSHSHLLFVDGIDIRPTSISFSEYLDCVKGLANAIWNINNDFLANIKDSKGRLRVVLLARPDIFDSIGLQNQNAKIRDNAVLLDWRTTYADYRYSHLFEMSDKMLRSQQKHELPIGIAWDYYFPYRSRNLWSKEYTDASFVDFLRLSMYRPRDIVTILRILQENVIRSAHEPSRVFSLTDVQDAEFTRRYSDYLLGEVKDQLSFYHTSEEYEIFLKFFQYLDGRTSFSYPEFRSAYDGLMEFVKQNSLATPIFFDAPDKFLQFLYELNVICYKEFDEETGDSFFHWCFRDRSPTNLAPKVKPNVWYSIHFGLKKALNIGRIFAKSLT